MKIVTGAHAYRDGDTELEAFVARPRESARLPLVLVAHMWAGRVPFVCDRARMLAELGYVGFALDMYGAGVIADGPEESARLMQPWMDNRRALQRRMRRALGAARALPGVDRARVAAIGFCFGGLCVLDLARSSAELAGVVSFHGLLTPHPDGPAASIDARVLILNGRDDPLVGPAEIDALADELTAAGTDWQMVTFGHAMHAFTNPAARDRAAGTHYEPRADRRSWRYATEFLAEVFERK